MTRAELLYILYKEVDSEIESHFTKKGITTWPCQPGCSECCERNFFPYNKFRI